MAAKNAVSPDAVEWVAFAGGGLFVAAATAIAFKPAILSAYRRAATAFQ